MASLAKSVKAAKSKKTVTKKTETKTTTTATSPAPEFFLQTWIRLPCKPAPTWTERRAPPHSEEPRPVRRERELFQVHGAHLGGAADAPGRPSQVRHAAGPICRDSRSSRPRARPPTLASGAAAEGRRQAGWARGWPEVGEGRSFGISGSRFGWEQNAAPGAPKSAHFAAASPASSLRPRRQEG